MGYPTPTRDYGEEPAAAAQEPRLVVEVARTNEILDELRQIHHRLIDRLRHVSIDQPPDSSGEDSVPKEEPASKTVTVLRAANNGLRTEIAKIRDLLAHLEV